MLMKFKLSHIAGLALSFAALLAATGVIHAQDLTAVSPASTDATSTSAPIPPPSVLTPGDLPFNSSTSSQDMAPPSSDQPVPMLFSAGDHPTSTEAMHSTSTHPMPPVHQEMGQENGDEQVVATSGDSPSVRAAKLARYWSLYRETGSDKIYAITTSNTKREIQTLAFFTAFDSNFGIKLMPKGSLDQFTVGDAITSTEGLNPADFRKAPQPCRLIKSADKPAVYLACLGIKRVIINEKAFKQFGWDFKHVMTTSTSSLTTMKDGDPVSESTVFDQGVTIDTSGIPAMSPTSERPKPSTTQPQSTPKVNGLTSTKGARLVKLSTNSRIFIITSDGKRHLLTNMDVVKVLKIDLSKVQTVTEDQLKAYPEGDSITLGTGGKEPTNTEHPPMMPVTTGGTSSTMPLPPVSEHPMTPPMPMGVTSSTNPTKPVAYIIKVGGTDAVYLVTSDNVKHRIYSTAGLGDKYTLMPLKEVTQTQLDVLQTGDSIGTAPASTSGSNSTSSTSSTGGDTNPNTSTASGI